MGASRQLIGLDLTRFAAAFMVMAFHLTVGVTQAAAWGWVGVEIFFVLSGFVIAYTAEHAAASQFARSRIVRLMPSVWLCGTIQALFWLTKGGAPHLAQRYAATMTLWPSGPWVDGAYWTLPVEVAFYALIFALLCFRWFRRVDWLFGALCVGSCVYWALRLLGTRFPHIPVPSGPVADLWLAYGCFFALGGVLWSSSRHGWTWWRAAVAIAALGAGGIQIVFASRSHGARASIAAPELVWLGALALIVFSVWRADLFDRWLGKWAGAVRLIGLATYPLYLLHDDMGTAMRDAMRGALPIWIAVIIPGVFFVAAALVVARYVEPALQRPLRAGLSKLSGTRARLRALVLKSSGGLTSVD